MLTDTTPQEQTKTARAQPFKKGAPSPNPKGRPKGQRDFTTELISSLRGVEQVKGKQILAHAWERAYVNDKVLVAMLKKILPDKLSLKTNGLNGDTHYHYTTINLDTQPEALAASVVSRFSQRTPVAAE